MKGKVKKLSIWILVMLMAFGNLLTGVSAATGYTYKSGNDSGVTGVTNVWEIKTLTDGTKDGITVTFSKSTASGDNELRYMSWSSDSSVQVKYVWVKASDGGHLYSYTNETSGVDLFGPLVDQQNWPHGISHVEIYYENMAQIKIQKVLQDESGNVISGDNQQFNINIKNGNDIINSCNLSNGEEAVFKLPLGTYTISEATPLSPYSFDKYKLGDSDSDGTVVLSEKGQMKVVIVINKKANDPPPSTGSITITKKIIHSDGSGSIVQGDDTAFTGRLVYAPETPTFVATSPYEFTVKPSAAAEKTQLPFGRYQVIEDAKDGYELQNQQPIYVTILENAANSSVELVNKKVKAQVIIYKELVNKTDEDLSGTNPDQTIKTYEIKLTGPNNTVSTYHVPVRTDFMTDLLPLGGYTVEEVNPPAGFDVTVSPSTFNLTSAGFKVTVTNKEKPDNPPTDQKGNIKVIKTITPSGIPQNGVEFKLYVGNGDIRSAITAVNGEAVFEAVPAGEYRLEEIIPTSFRTDAATRSVNVEADKTTVVNVTNTPILNQGEIYDPGLKIKGYKYNDLNKNGRRDEGEAGLPNWKIQLWQNNSEQNRALAPLNIVNTPLAEDITDENGYYEFTGLSSGHYIVKEVQQAGWACSTSLERTVWLYGNPYSYETTTMNLLDDANFKKAMPNENTVFEAEGRIGLPDNRDYELDLKTIYPTTVIKAQEYVDGWKNFAEPQPFRLSLRHTGNAGAYKITITFEALGRTLQTVLDNQYPDDIMIRTRSAEAGSGIIINKLKLNERSVNGTSVAVNGIRDTDVLWLTNLNLGVYSNFDLTGETMMYWDSNAAPERSELAFQIAVGDVVRSQTEVIDFGNYQTDGSESELPTITKTDELTSASAGENLTYKIAVDPNDYNLVRAYLLESPDPNTEYIGGNEWELVETKADGKKVYKYNLYTNMPTVRSLDVPNVPQIPDFKVRVKSEIPRAIGLVTNNVKLYFDVEKDPAVATDTTAINHPPIYNEPNPPVVNPGTPDLKVTKTDKGAMVSPGALVEYFIEVENKGNAPAVGVKVYETLPEGTTFVENSNQGWILENGRYVYSLGLMNVGDKKEAKFVLQVNTPFPTGIDKILNNVEVKDNGTETATTDNKASDDTPVMIPASVVVQPPVVPTPVIPTPVEVSTPPEPQRPDLPFTGGAAEVEIVFAGIGMLLMAGSMFIKKR